MKMRENSMDVNKQFTTFDEFYPFYLSQHSNIFCRLFHFIGTSVGISCFILSLFTAQPLLILGGIILGYIFSWIGHLFFEKNKPATFHYPIYSLMGDFKMFREMLFGKILFY
jgi:hypothetical protein